MKLKYIILWAIIIALAICCFKCCLNRKDEKECCLLPVCEAEVCKPLDYVFVPGELVISYPKDSTSNVSGDATSQIANFYLKNLGIELQNSQLEDISIDTCICNQNIFKIFDSLLIGHETGVAQAGNASSGGEGPKWSPNWIIEDSHDNVPSSIFENSHEIPPIGNSTGDSTIVAILDTGVKDWLIPLNNRIQPLDLAIGLRKFTDFGINVIEENYDVEDDNNHGTAVTSVLLYTVPKILSSNDTINLKVLPIKVLDSFGRGTVFNVTCGIHCADVMSADVVNMSLGAYRENVQFERAISEVTRDSNLYIVASAGNKNLNLSNNIHVPSEYTRPTNSNFYIDMDHVPDFVLEVGGLCSEIEELCDIDSRVLWTGSNYGEGMFVAPSIGFSGVLGDPDIRYDCIVPGTSFAAPQISAALAVEYGRALKFNFVHNLKSQMKLSLNTYTNNLSGHTHHTYIYNSCL